MAFSTLAFANELRMVGCEIWELGDADIESTFNFHPDDPSHPDNMKISRQRRQEQIAKVKPAGDETDGRDEEQAKLRAIGEEYIGIDGNTYQFFSGVTWRGFVKENVTYFAMEFRRVGGSLDNLGCLGVI